MPPEDSNPESSSNPITDSDRPSTESPNERTRNPLATEGEDTMAKAATIMNEDAPTKTPAKAKGRGKATKTVETKDMKTAATSGHEMDHNASSERLR